ncbi:MAG TPA: ATP-binding protein [Acidimicrobiales bacterium]|nr:ATP-binding protein [Acidimicrobiales bacterium]
MAIPLLVLLANWMVLLYLTGAEQVERQASSQAASVAQTSNQVLTDLLNAETGVRGYLLSGQATFVEPYQAAVRQLPSLLSRLAEQAQSRPVGVVGEVRRVRTLAEHELATLGQLRSAGGAAQGTVQPLLVSGKTTMDALRRELGVIAAAEQVRVTQSQSALTGAQLGILIVLITTIPLGVAGGLVATRLFTRGIVRRISAVQHNAQNLIDARELPPAPVDADEIGQLARAVNAAGRLLTERQAALTKAAGVARDANQAKSEFLSRMSHELRTPLNAILGFGQLLAVDVRSNDDRESVAQILKAGRHLLDLINEVLDLSRTESGHLGLSMEPVDVGEVVDEAAQLMRPMAAHAGCQVRIDLPGESEVVLADRQRLKQVLLNLLSNGIKYNRPGGLVTLRYSAPTLDRVQIEVADSGIGIAPELLPRLFSPFDRLGAEQGEIAGTGLGLALSRSLVDAMGGQIEATSEPGRGTSFVVSLRRVTASKVAELDAPTALAVSVGRAAGTVVYIEDNLANLRLVERILAQRPQVHLVPAMQGKLGLELAVEHTPRLVLLDLHLPDIDGVDVLRRLRLHPNTKDVAVFILTADATPGQKSRLLAEGATGYLTKPIQVADFLRILDAEMADATPEAVGAASRS